MNKKAIYPGSFDPFTNGHLDIVRKSAAIFDQVYVVIGVNANKKRTFSANRMISAIEKALADAGITNAVVTSHAGLVAQYAKEQGIPVVFCTELSSGRIADSICAETGAVKRSLHSCANVTKDEAAAGETYLSLMQKNLSVLREALGDA